MRQSSASTPVYSARPPHTPASTLLRLLRRSGGRCGTAAAGGGGACCHEGGGPSAGGGDGGGDEGSGGGVAVMPARLLTPVLPHNGVCSRSTRMTRPRRSGCETVSASQSS